MEIDFEKIDKALIIIMQDKGLVWCELCQNWKSLSDRANIKSHFYNEHT